MKQTFSSFLAVFMLILASGPAEAQENASNPLAAVSNTDRRFQYFDPEGSDRRDYWIGGDRPYDWGAGLGARFNY